MNKKIYLNIYEDDKRLKKLRLDEGVYTVGNNKKDVDIFVEEESLENCLKVTVKSDRNVFIKFTNNNKNVLLNNSKVSAVDEKVEIKHNDQISFKKSNKSIKFRFEEIIRERSRSKEQKQTIETHQPAKEKPKPEADNTNKAYIKSEVIWNSVSFEDEKRKEKFLKLMGAKKKNPNESPSTTLDQKESEKLKDTFQKIERDLTKQYYNALGRK